MSKLRKSLRYLGAAIALLGILVLFEILLEHPMGLFSGTRPTGLGFNAGKFSACSWKPNCVSSTTDSASDAKHFVEPLKFTGAAEAAWKKLKATLGAMPRMTIVTEQANYLHAEFASATMGFVDDTEFALDANAQVIHVRSAARLGVRDFGVNRARIEAIREQFGKS
jgi:uncharacterized protein (DUF1499 family)